LEAYPQKSNFRFRFNTKSGGFFPMLSIFYLKPQGLIKYIVWP